MTRHVVLEVASGCLGKILEIGEEVDRGTQGQDMVPTDTTFDIAEHEHLQLLKYLCSLFAFVPHAEHVCVYMHVPVSSVFMWMCVCVCVSVLMCIPFFLWGLAPGFGGLRGKGVHLHLREVSYSLAV